MKWDENKENELKKLISQGKTYKEISELMGMTFRSITNKCIRLGVKYLKKESKEIVSCYNCGKSFKSYKSDKRRFCNNSCSAKFNNTGRILSEEIKNKITIGVKNYNKENNVKRVRPNCLVCGKKVKKNHNIYCSSECQKSCLLYKEKLSKNMKDRFKKNPELHPNRLCAGIKESYPEKFFREFIEKNGLTKGLDFIQQFKFDIYYVDFFFPKLNLCVEIDGERFHDENSLKEITRETKIIENYKLKRYKVKTLLKKEYENDILNIINDVKNFEN
jgi:very-short-patch-repair endonuclease